MILNKMHRYHSEFVEKLPIFVIVLLVSGLYLPAAAMTVGISLATIRLFSFLALFNLGSECKGLKVMKDIAGNGPILVLGAATFIY